MIPNIKFDIVIKFYYFVFVLFKSFMVLLFKDFIKYVDIVF
jgi:hypothetical protein